MNADLGGIWVIFVAVCGETSGVQINAGPVTGRH
jgi:hypothetical protein